MSYFSELSRGERPARAVWLPFLETLAAQVAGCELQAIVSDATRWANALPRVATLLEVPALAVGFVDGFGACAFADNPEEPWRHPALEALLECTRRLAETERPGRDLVVAMPGPLAVCAALGEPLDKVVLEKIKASMVKLLEAICACRPDMVILNETVDAERQATGPDYRRICNTLKNVTEYFGIGLGIRVSGYGDAPKLLRELRTLRLDHLMLGLGAGPTLSAAELMAAAEGQGWRSVGIAIESGQGVGPLPQQGTGYYWCSAGQEQDLEQARNLGLALAAAL